VYEREKETERKKHRKSPFVTKSYWTMAVLSRRKKVCLFHLEKEKKVRRERERERERERRKREKVFFLFIIVEREFIQPTNEDTEEK
jgi:hypothetical protein